MQHRGRELPLRSKEVAPWTVADRARGFQHRQRERPYRFQAWVGQRLLFPQRGENVVNLTAVMASGEIGASLHIYRNHAMVSAERGSSVGWVPMELVPTNSGCVGLAAQPPHPHAAALFIDYLLSPNGRMVLEKYQYGHPSNEWPFKRWHPGFGRSLEQFEKDSDKWEKLAKEITRR